MGNSLDSRDTIIHRLVGGLVFLTILRPLPGTVGPDLVVWKRVMDVVWLVFVVSIGLCYIIRSQSISLSLLPGIGWLGSISTLSITSAFMSATVLETPVVYSDLLEPYRWIYYALVLSIAGGVRWSKHEIKEHLVRPLTWGLGVSYLITFIAAVNPYGRGALTLLYNFDSGGRDLITRIASRTEFGFYYRSSGTFINPNFYGVFISYSIPFILSYYSNIKSKAKRRAVSFVSLFSFAAIVITGSRTAIICSVISVSIYCVLVYKRGDAVVHKKFVFGILVCIALAAVLVAPKLARIVYTVQQIRTGGLLEIASLEVKYNQTVRYVSNTISKSPIIGIGPAKGVNQYLGDNQYAKQFVRYGLSGLFLLLGFLITVAKRSWSRLYSEQNSMLVCFRAAIVSSVVAILISFLTGGFFENTQISTIMFILFGVSYSTFSTNHS